MPSKERFLQTAYKPHNGAEHSAVSRWVTIRTTHCCMDTYAAGEDMQVTTNLQGAAKGGHQ
jgi:hypothetical protein